MRSTAYCICSSSVLVSAAGFWRSAPLGWTFGKAGRARSNEGRRKFSGSCRWSSLVNGVALLSAGVEKVRMLPRLMLRTILPG